MTDIIEMTSVTHLILDSGLLLHVYGTREQVKHKINMAVGGGTGTFVDFDVQTDDTKDPVSQVTVRLGTIAMIGRTHAYEGPTSVPFPQATREGTVEAVL